MVTQDYCKLCIHQATLDCSDYSESQINQIYSKIERTNLIYSKKVIKPEDIYFMIEKIRKEKALLYTVDLSKDSF